MISSTEENYLKAILKQTVFSLEQNEVGVNKLAEYLSVKPATVSDMVKKLRDKQLVNYERYGKVSLTDKGRKHGMMIIRRHRLWETFLYEKLNFSWGEIHDIAEQLEHVYAENLINRLDDFLGNPAFDPHGDAIPNEEGEILIPFRKTLLEAEKGEKYQIIAVKDDSEFLHFFDSLGLKINDIILVKEKDDFDDLITIHFDQKMKVVSPKFSENVYIDFAR